MRMRERILNLITDLGTLIQPEAVDYILTKEETIHYVQNILDNLEEPPLILTIEHLRKVEKIGKKAASSARTIEPKVTILEPKSKPQPVIVKPKTHVMAEEKPLDNFAVVGLSTKKQEVCSAQELPEDIKIFRDITGNSTCQGKIGDFKQYFNDRLITLRKILRARREMAGAINLSRVKIADASFKVIGIVSDIRTTKNGHKMIKLEDETDSISVLLPKDSGLVNDMTVLDEVIGIIGTKSRNGGLVLAQELVRPDVPVNRNSKYCDENIFAAFVSDTHVGSKTFLKEEFGNFLGWLKGSNGRKRDVAKKVGYLVVPGDTVDGIGVYPDQEEELAIDDIYDQYKELASLLKQVPEHIKVIMLPGNHDAVRPAEPQPTFPQEIRELFSHNVIFTGNPCYFSLHGVEVLAYHGRSMDDFIKALPSLDYTKSIKIMIEMLKKRHLAPIYGGRTPIAPEHRDYLVINRIPDIFVTGHGHSTGIEKYRGITLINASAWQSQTNYQKMHNFIPDPAKVPIYNLSTGEVSIIDFS
jgi:DNA polymerase II small subunit